MGVELAEIRWSLVQFPVAGFDYFVYGLQFPLCHIFLFPMTQFVFCLCLCICSYLCSYCVFHFSVPMLLQVVPKQFSNGMGTSQLGLHFVPLKVCSSGLRGWPQVPLVQDAWVQIHSCHVWKWHCHMTITYEDSKVLFVVFVLF